MDNGQAKTWTFAIIASVVSVLATSFTWMLLTVGMRADIAVLKSNMADVRASIREIERGLGAQFNQ